MMTHLADIGIVDVLKKMNSKCLLSNSYRYSYQFKACDVQFKESHKIIRNRKENNGADKKLVSQGLLKMIYI